VRIVTIQTVQRYGQKKLKLGTYVGVPMLIGKNVTFPFLPPNEAFLDQ
jgi:hypothetical protein